MPHEPDTSALERFARDLRRIREDREVSLATVHADTQVPQSQLQSFEAGTLYEESSLTPVYLRGFVRSYAEAIGLSPDPVLDHLESALSGEYDNQLAAEYLDVPPSVPETGPSSEPPDASAEEEEQPPSSPTGDQEKSENEAPTPVSEKGATGHSDRPASSVSRETPAARQEHSSSGTWEAFWRKHRSTLLVGLTGLVLFGVFAVLISTYLGDATSSSESPSDPAPRAVTPTDPSTPDTLAAPDTSATEASPEPPSRADVTLGDTLYVTVLATADVRGMRVRQDDDLRRPYWIREGRAKVFPFTRRITIQNQLDSLRLLFEGYPYPVSQTDEEGRIVITGDKAQQFIDTLRATPSTVPGSPDTVWGGAPTSTAISRPRSARLPEQRRR